jgi:Flp pilus assembly protein TadD
MVLAPTHLVPIITEAAAERRMYLPLAALASLAVVGCFALLHRKNSSNGRNAALAIAALAFLLAAIYGVADARRLDVYQSATSLWRDVVRHQPHSRIGNYNLAVELAAEGRLEEAIVHSREAVRLNPEQVESRYYLGRLLGHVGQSEEAIEHLQKVVELQPDASRTRNNLGVLLFGQGRVDEAIVQYLKAIDLQPEMWEAYDNLGRAQLQKGEFNQAVETYRLALLLKPDDVAIGSHLAEAYFKAGRPEEAIQAAEMALKLAHSTGQKAAAEKLEVSLASYRAGEAVPPNSPRPGEPKPRIE